MTTKEEDGLTNCIIVMQAISKCEDKNLAADAIDCFADIMNIYLPNIEPVVCLDIELPKCKLPKIERKPC